MWSSPAALPYIQILLLVATASTQLVALPFERQPLRHITTTPHHNDQLQPQYQQQQQQPLMGPPPQSPSPPAQEKQQQQQPKIQQLNVTLSDVMGRDRSMNAFAGFARDAEAVARRLEDADRNSTVLAPRNSAVDGLPRKPWEDPRDYAALGAGAYDDDDEEGGGGRERARRNLRRFVEAHVVPASPWAAGERRRTLLGGDREIWWEAREGDGVRVIQPDNIEVASISSRVGNGEVWILKGVRNYA